MNEEDSVLNQQKNNSEEQRKIIDFKKMLVEYRERTEFEMPYTPSQIEDTMFVNDNTLVSLEYIYYQKNVQYSTLKQKKDRKRNSGGVDTKVPIVLEDSQDNYLDTMQTCAVEVVCPESYITLWQIGSEG